MKVFSLIEVSVVPLQVFYFGIPTILDYNSQLCTGYFKQLVENAVKTQVSLGA